MALPWDVLATPIEARKLARLGVERGEVVLRPAFFRPLGASYGAASRASCPFHPHEAPQADCSCGFYAVTTDGELGRLGADEPDLAVLDVELAGRVIEHEHGFRASHQRARAVELHGACVRCGKTAEVLHQRVFGALVPACRRCARRHVMSLEEVGVALGVPVRFAPREAPPAPRLNRLALVLSQALAPVFLLAIAAAVAVSSRSAAPLAIGQIALVAWLAAVPWSFGRLARRVGLPRREVIRLQHRWNPVVAAVALVCDLALAGVVVRLAA